MVQEIKVRIIRRITIMIDLGTMTKEIGTTRTTSRMIVLERMRLLEVVMGQEMEQTTQECDMLAKVLQKVESTHIKVKKMKGNLSNMSQLVDSYFIYIK